MERALAISSLRSGKALPDPYKDHPIHQGSSEEIETSIIVEQDSDLEDEEEHVTTEPNPNKYKPPVPYPQALNRPKAKNSETDDNLLDAFKKVTITIPLIDFIKHIPSYAKFLKGISSTLEIKQEEKLLEVLRKNEVAIGWTLTDLKGLDPSLCTHRIFLENELRPVREAQRRLNPRVWEAVKEEIFKWLNAKIIYPISDNQWVSPVHVIPKKAGVTVTTNEKGEEI